MGNHKEMCGVFTGNPAVKVSHKSLYIIFIMSLTCLMWLWLSIQWGFKGWHIQFETTYFGLIMITAFFTRIDWFPVELWVFLDIPLHIIWECAYELLERFDGGEDVKFIHGRTQSGGVLKHAWCEREVRDRLGFYYSFETRLNTRSYSEQMTKESFHYYSMQ